MHYHQKLLTKLINSTERRSISSAARLLGFSRAKLHSVINGEQAFTDETLLRIAKALKLDPVIVVCKAHLDGEKCPEMRQFYKLVLDTRLRMQALEKAGFLVPESEQKKAS